MEFIIVSSLIEYFCYLFLSLKKAGNKFFTCFQSKRERKLKMKKFEHKIPRDAAFEKLAVIRFK